MRKILSVVGLFLFGFIIFVIARNENIKDWYYSKKYPASKEFYFVNGDDKWELTHDSLKAEYYRLVSYDKNGNPVGIIRDYYMTGGIQWEGHVSKLKPFTREGTCKRYYINGNIESKMDFLAGKETGEAKLYDETGNLKAIRHYQNGIYEGEAKVFHKNGNVEMNCYYTNGRKNGYQTHYSYEGKEEYQRFYSHDTLIITGYYLDKFTDNFDNIELSTLHELVLRGDKAARRGEFRKAERYYDAVLMEMPEHVYVLEQRAMNKINQNNITSAREDFEECIRMGHPSKLNLMFQVASTFYLQDSLINAMKEYSAIIFSGDTTLTDERETVGKSFNMKGVVNVRQEKFSEAVEEFSNAISLTSDNSVYYSNRGYTYMKMGKPYYDLALSDSRNSLELDKYSDVSLSVISQVLYDREDYYTAAVYAMKAYEINPQNILAGGLVMATKSYFPEAVRVYNRGYHDYKSELKHGVDELFLIYRLYETAHDIATENYSDAWKDIWGDLVGDSDGIKIRDFVKIGLDFYLN